MECVYCHNYFSRKLTVNEIVCMRPIINNGMCEECLSHFSWIKESEQRCKYCMKLSETRTCHDCLSWKKVYPTYSFHHEALFDYTDAMQEWFLQYKFKGNILLGQSFSKDISRYFLKKKNHLIVPIPLSKKRLIERGFNQVEVLLKNAEISTCSVLNKKEGSVPQSEKKRKERLVTPQSFYINKSFERAIHGKKVILVDDVYTTGRTMFHAAQIILKYSPLSLETFSLTR